MKKIPESIIKADPKRISDAREWFGTSAKQIELKEKITKPKPQRWKVIILQSKINRL